MSGIIPKQKIKGVDICGSKDYYYIIRSDLGCYMRSSNFRAGSDLSIHDLHPACQHGDHYFADSYYFYIIKGDEYRRVTDLTEDTDSSVYTLPPECRGGDHYLSSFNKRPDDDELFTSGWLYIIFQEKGTYRRATLTRPFIHFTESLSGCSDEFPLHPNCRKGLYYWGDPEHLYLLKPNEWGVEYYKCTDFKKGSCVSALSFLLQKNRSVYSVHPDVLNFLPGGLSITNGPAFSRWENIKTVSNDSPTPVSWQKKVTKKVGYNKEKLSEITHNWKTAASFSISTGKLAKLISNVEFSLSVEYGGSSVNTEKETSNKENEEEEQLSFELKPKQCLYLWQYQLGLGSEPVLFCRDLKITGQPNPPTEVPLSPVSIVDPPTKAPLYVCLCLCVFACICVCVCVCLTVTFRFRAE